MLCSVGLVCCMCFVVLSCCGVSALQCWYFSVSLDIVALQCLLFLPVPCAGALQCCCSVLLVAVCAGALYSVGAPSYW